MTDPKNTNKTNRRGFIKGSASALVGIGFFSGVAPRAFSSSPNEKLNLGMIGCGGKGETNFMAFNSQKQNIIAMCDVDDSRTTLSYKMNAKAKKFHDYRQMLDEVPELDAVIVSTPDHHHAPAGLRCIEHGKHVYIEKPMAHSIYEARRLTEAAQKAGVATQMGNQGHANTIAREGVEALQSGVIGGVTEVHAWTDRPSWAQGNRIPGVPTEAMPVPETLQWDLWLGPASERAYNSCYMPRIWRGWWDFGTGSMGDMGCHILDMAYWGLKLEWPNAVSAQVPAIYPHTPPEWGIITFEFPARGDMPPVKVHWYDGGKQPDAALFDGEAIPGNGALMIGTEGKMLMTDTYGNAWTLLPREKFAAWTAPAAWLPRAQSHYNEWIEAAKGGPKSQSNFTDYAGKFTETVLAGNIALRLGKRFTWDGPSMSSPDCPEATALATPTFRDGWKV